MTPHAPFLVDEPDSLGKDGFGHVDFADALRSVVTDLSRDGRLSKAYQ
jgi:hypothetical protein